MLPDRGLEIANEIDAHPNRCEEYVVELEQLDHEGDLHGDSLVQVCVALENIISDDPSRAHSYVRWLCYRYDKHEGKDVGRVSERERLTKNFWIEHDGDVVSLLRWLQSKGRRLSDVWRTHRSDSTCEKTRVKDSDGDQTVRYIFRRKPTD